MEEKSRVRPDQAPAARVAPRSLRPLRRDSPADARRRRWLQGLAALAGASLVPQGIAQGTGVSAAQATALQKSLVGFAYDDAKIVEALLRALASAVGGKALAQVAQLASTTPAAGLDAALRTAGLESAAVTILVALASGVVNGPQGAVVITYNEALAWQAVPWTKPSALCGGMTDYWASAPTEGK